MSEHERLIALLSPIQREELYREAAREDGKLVIRGYMHPGVRCALQRKGILRDRMYSQELTALGEIVREAVIRGRKDPTP